MATQPELIEAPFASAGAKNTIPATTTTLGKASLRNGFPTETSMPIADGGIPPRREDFNGMLYWLSTFAVYQQSGGQFTYNATVNYDAPSIIYYDGDLWWCKASNGPNTVVKPPTAENSAYWIKLRDYLANPLAAYPIGTYYISSVATSPATLFGGTWQQVRDRFILAAGSMYSTGTLANPATGGNATKTLTVANIPSHTHTFTTGDAGLHTHAVTGTTQTAGSHTHDVSGTTGGAGSHSHTRGTMDIVGTIGTGSNTPSIYRNDTSGAFYNSGTDGNRFGSGTTTNDRTSRVTFQASRSWNGSTSVQANHTHGFSATTQSSGSHTHTVSISAANNGTHKHTGTTNGAGNGTAFDIMPPYIVAYVWRRTA